MGESGPRVAQGLSEDAGLRYILAIMDDLISVSLKPATVCTDDITAASLLIGCKIWGVPCVSVREPTR